MALSKGEKAPPFAAPDQHGKTVSQSDVEGPFVLYFYPRDDTPICTRQACGFQEGVEALRALNAQVIGVSTDSVASHKAFADKHGIKFPLLADTDGKIVRAYDVKGLLGSIQRVTYVVDADGTIRGVRRNEFSGRGHMEWARKTLAGLRGGPSTGAERDRDEPPSTIDA